MLTVYDVKNYIRCDDDDEQVKALMAAADSYMAGAIDNYADTYEKAGRDWQAKADLAKKLLITDWYENRTPTDRPATASVVLLLTQLQLEGAENAE